MTRLSPEIKLFAHYSIPRPETYAKIGEYVCGTPLHVTFAGILTREPEAVIDKMRELLAPPMQLPHMSVGDLILAHSHYRTKPIVKLHDAARRLTELQTSLYDSLGTLRLSKPAPRSQYTDSYTPHVTIDRIFCQPVLPKEFDIDHIIVTTGTKIGAGHWHNYVWDIIPLTDIAE